MSTWYIPNKPRSKRVYSLRPKPHNSYERNCRRERLHRLSVRLLLFARVVIALPYVYWRFHFIKGRQISLLVLYLFFHKIPWIITRHIKIKRGSLKYKVRQTRMLRCIYTCLSKRRQNLLFFCVHDIMVLSTSLQGKIYFGILQVQSRQRGLNKYKRKVALLPFHNKMYKLIWSARFKCPASNYVGPKLDTTRKKSSVIVYFCSALSVWYSTKSNYQSLLSSRAYLVAQCLNWASTTLM